MHFSMIDSQVVGRDRAANGDDNCQHSSIHGDTDSFIHKLQRMPLSSAPIRHVVAVSGGTRNLNNCTFAVARRHPSRPLPD
jgi:hypothetical protein